VSPSKEMQYRKQIRQLQDTVDEYREQFVNVSIRLELAENRVAQCGCSGQDVMTPVRDA